MVEAERFSVYAVFFPKFVKCILLEGRLDTVEDVKDVVFLGPPRPESPSESEIALLRDERVEYIGYELDSWRTVWVVVREGQAELQGGICVVPLVNEQNSVPDKEVVW